MFKRLNKVIFGASLTILLSGCINTGLPKLDRSCANSAGGMGCASTEEIYGAMINGNLNTKNGNNSYASTRAANTTYTSISNSNRLYVPPEEKRLWINEWIDDQGDLNSSSEIYVVVDGGSWNLKH